MLCDLFRSAEWEICVFERLAKFSWIIRWTNCIEEMLTKTRKDMRGYKNHGCMHSHEKCALCINYSWLQLLKRNAHKQRRHGECKNISRQSRKIFMFQNIRSEDEAKFFFLSRNFMTLKTFHCFLQFQEADAVKIVFLRRNVIWQSDSGPLRAIPRKLLLAYLFID